MRALFGRLLAVAALALSVQAHAQGAIQQSGAVVPFHAGSWFRNGVQGDAGTPSAPYLNELGLFNGANCPLGVSSQTSPGVSLTPYALFTVCQTNTATTLTFAGMNGQANPSVFFNIGGVSYPFPGPGNGDVIGPLSAVDDHVACFAGTSGTIIADCGGFLPSLTGPNTWTGLQTFNGGVATTTLTVNSKPVIAQPCPQIEAYGGVGNGSTPNDTAMANALAASPANQQCVAFGPGVFLFSTVKSTVLTTGQHYRVVGAGPTLTELRFPNGQNGFQITLNDQTTSADFEDFSLTTQGAGSGNAITFTQIAGFSGNSVAPSYVNDVVIRGADGFNQTDYWATAITQNASNLNISGVNVYSSASGLQGVGLKLFGNNSGAIAIQTNVTDSNFWYVGTGVNYGTYYQGLNIKGGTFVGGNIAIFQGPSQNSNAQLSISGTEFDSLQDDIELQSGIVGTAISSSYFIVHPGTNTAGIFIQGEFNFAITGNYFECASQTSTIGVVIGQRQGGTGEGGDGGSGTVEGNVVNNCATGMSLASNAGMVTLQGNAFDEIGTSSIVNFGCPSCFILNNIGYNPVGPSNVTVGASPATITNGSTPATYYLKQSATNTATVVISAATICTLTAGTTCTVNLGPNEAFNVVWTTTAPTYVVSVH